MRLFYLMCLTWSSLLLASVKAEDGNLLFLKSGGTIQFVSAAVEGDFLDVVMENGRMKLPKASLAAKSLKVFFPEPVEDSPPAPVKETVSVVATEVKQVVETPPPVPMDIPVPEKPVPRADFLVATVLPDHLPDMPDLDKNKKFKAEKVLYEIKSKMPGREKVKIEALVPKDKEGKIPDSASDIVFYAPYLNYKNMHGRPGAQDTRIFWELCEVHGMTVFTAQFDTKAEEVEDREACYYYPESGSFDVVFNVREKLIKEYKLVKKKFFVIGNSGGSSMAERLGLLYSADVAAVAMMGGGRFDPVDRKVGVSWLVLNTRGDSRAAQNVALVEQLRANGMNALYGETEPLAKTKEDYLKQDEHNFHHSASDLGFDLLQNFIVSIAVMERSGKGSAEAPQNWPMTSGTKDTFQISKPDPSMAKADPGLFKDHVFYPSEEFSLLWRNIPYRKEWLTLPDGKMAGQTLACLVRYPRSNQKVMGLLIFNAGHSSSQVQAEDCLDYFADRGLIAMTASFSGGEFRRLAETKALLDWGMKSAAWNSLPVYLLGEDVGGRHMILASCGFKDERLKCVSAIDPQFDWPFPELSPLANISKISLPIMLVEKSGPQPNQQTFIDSTQGQQKVVKKVSLKKGTLLHEGMDAFDQIISYLLAI